MMNYRLKSFSFEPFTLASQIRWPSIYDGGQQAEAG